MDDKTVIVAIDGPSASGKSTVSRALSERMGFRYVDSGAIYRGITWQALRKLGAVDDSKKVLEVLAGSAWSSHVTDGAVRFAIDGVDPGDELRSEAVREAVSDVAALPEVRKFVVDQLRAMQCHGSLVMEGRDIGSVVFPETPFKYYLDADAAERARRRTIDLEQRSEDGDVADVMASLARRDRKDSTRKTAPLQIALGARVINSTGMTVDEVVDVIVADLDAG